MMMTTAVAVAVVAELLNCHETNKRQNDWL